MRLLIVLLLAGCAEMPVSKEAIRERVMGHCPVEPAPVIIIVSTKE